MKRIFFSTLLLLAPVISFASTCTAIKPIPENVFVEGLGARKVTFVAFDFNTKECNVIDKNRLAERHAPHSTFKIPHSLIALEVGAVKSADISVEWDNAKFPAQSYWPDTWRQSQTLATAFRHSVVWYYQAMVPLIPPSDYKKWLEKFQYGNKAFTSGSNRFWLNGELQISPIEQVNFLVCILNHHCGLKSATYSVFESIALQETSNGFTLFAKTGAGPINTNDFDGAFEGWYVGYIKNNAGKPIAAFAMYMEAENFSGLQVYRKELTVKLLTHLGYWIARP